MKRKQQSAEDVEAQAYDLNPYSTDYMGGASNPYSTGDTHLGTAGGLSYETLRALARMPIISAIVQTRVNQVAEFGRPQPDRYSAGYIIRLRDQKAELEEHHKTQIAALTEWLTSCGDPEVVGWTTFENFLRAITRDSLTFDQCCFEVVKDDSRIVAFKAVDAATIRRASPSLEEIQKGRRDPSSTAFCQVLENRIVAEFERDEMAFGVRRPRTELSANGYGFPELEEVAPTVMDMMRAKSYNSSNFTHGLHLSGILAIKSKMSPALFRAFRREFYSMLQGPNGAKKTPIIQLDPESKEEVQSVTLSNSNSDMEYSQWLNFLIKEICAIYQMDPSELGYMYGNEGQSSSLNSSGPADRIKYSREKGLRPLLRAVETWINRWVIYPLAPHLELCFVGLDTQSEEKRLDTIKKRVSSHLTVNEARAMFDLEPLDSPIADMILDSSYINAANMAAQQGEEGEEGEEEDDGQPTLADLLSNPLSPDDEIEIEEETNQ
jgi:hypothetical protein